MNTEHLVKYCVVAIRFANIPEQFCAFSKYTWSAYFTCEDDAIKDLKSKVRKIISEHISNNQHMLLFDLNWTDSFVMCSPYNTMSTVYGFGNVRLVQTDRTLWI